MVRGIVLILTRFQGRREAEDSGQGGETKINFLQKYLHFRKFLWTFVIGMMNNANMSWWRTYGFQL